MSDEVQAASSVVSFLIAVVAAWVAWVAKGIAADARDAEKAQAAIAADALRATRLQIELQAVPHLIASNARINEATSTRPARFVMHIVNGGPTVAYGVMMSAAVATARDLDAIDESTRGGSRREPGLAPGQPLQTLGAPMPYDGEWIAVRLEYYSPLGADVVHDYIWGRQESKWRLHRVTIRPSEGPPLRFDLRLSPGDAEPPESQEALVAWA
jgi:hypothetical protein